MLPVIYQDDHFIAIDKPEKWLVHRSAIDKYETRFVLQVLRDQVQQHLFPVHRLDKPTSGVLLFAFSPTVANALSQQFSEHTIQKHYLALVRGFTPMQGDIDHALSIKDDFKSKRKRQVSTPQLSKLPQAALTRYRRRMCYELPVAIDRYPQSRFTLVEARPVTGRKHQLRRHLKHIAHPIIGDPKYGKSAYNHYFAAALATDRLLLHCESVELQHPVTGAPMTISAPLSGQFAALLTALAPYQCAASVA